MPSSSKLSENIDVSDLVIGVLELQGDFAEHTAMLRRCGVRKVMGIRLKEDLVGLDGIVIPGGESTVMSKLLVAQDMLAPLQQLAREGLPMFGTCAGCILLAARVRSRGSSSDDDVDGTRLPRVAALDVTVARNFYGSQIDSFEALVEPEAGGALVAHSPLRVVHIRAPAILEAGEKARAIASHAGRAILVQQGSILGCTFHPELTQDVRVHMLFLQIAAERKEFVGRKQKPVVTSS